MNHSALVILRDIKRSYSSEGIRTDVLSGVTTSVARGEMVALTGGSGSGKTTLANIIGLLDVANSGSYILDGIQTTVLSSGQRAKLRRERIGFLFQNFELLNGLTATENVALPLLYRGEAQRAAMARAEELLAAVGLSNHGGKTPLQLSGGQQQRVALARAVANLPRLLVADEPTGNLDKDSADAVIGLLRARCALDGSAVVVVTHDLSVASACDRRLILTGGQISDAAESAQ